MKTPRNLILLAILSTTLAFAQTAVHQAKPSTASPKDDFKFEVVSVRPIAGQHYGFRSDPTPSGFNAELSLDSMIKMCFTPEWFPQWYLFGAPLSISNEPNWGGDSYEIKARVADSDLDVWHDQSKRKGLLRSAIRNVLKERFQLVTHQQPIEVSGYHLVTSKKGAKLKVTLPEFVQPTGRSLNSGGVAVAEGRTQWHYYNATMRDLAEFLSVATVSPVEDRTNLKGHYEFVIKQIDHAFQEGVDPIDRWPIDQLGLTLKPGKVPGLTLIIDHIEKPDPN